MSISNIDKIKAEIERRMRVMKENFATDEASKTKHALTLRLIDHQELLAFIDSMQEEPTSVWHDISEKPKMNSIIVMNNDHTTLSVEYVGQSLCGIERWAYLDILLKL